MRKVWYILHNTRLRVLARIRARLGRIDIWVSNRVWSSLDERIFDCIISPISIDLQGKINR